VEPLRLRVGRRTRSQQLVHHLYLSKETTTITTSAQNPALTVSTGTNSATKYPLQSRSQQLAPPFLPVQRNYHHHQCLNLFKNIATK